MATCPPTTASFFWPTEGPERLFRPRPKRNCFIARCKGSVSSSRKKIAKDGEGASKFLEIHVEGARSVPDAQKMAMTVATSPLVKTAAHGEDSNWGRILAAMGRSGVSFNPSRVDIAFGSLYVFRRGAPTAVSAEKAREPLKAKEVDAAHPPACRQRPGLLLDVRLYRAVCRHQRALPDVSSRPAFSPKSLPVFRPAPW